MKIGILGGTFDPIHNGHLNMAKNAYEEYELDEVWVIPTGPSPHKKDSKITSAAYRFKMCELATEEDDRLKACDFEMKWKETSYTYRTLERLTEMYPDNEFYFIMGGDSIDYFKNWYHPEIIAKLSVILVAVREGFPVIDIQNRIVEIEKLFTCDIRLLHCKQYDISSTLIREKSCDIEFLKENIPENVVSYIIDKKLYQ